MAVNNMLNEIKFAFFAIKKNIQGSAELRASFIMNVVGMAINNAAFILLWVFFVQSVGVIGGWKSADIVGLQGFVALSYGIVLSIAYGLRNLPDYVASGAFDRYMLSPKNLLLRVATSSFNASTVGDVAFGIICLIVYSILIHANLAQILMMIAMILLATIVFLAMTITIFSAGFFFIDAHTAVSGLFELFLTPSLFHGGAFQGAMRFVFTFLIPSLLIGTLPVEAVKNVSLTKLALTGILALIWFVISICFFYSAVKKYESSNFMTFGG